MELRQLNYFIQAADTLNFTEAAKKVHISQSTLSQQIQQLEISLNADLFHRNGKRIALTKEGEVFYAYAKECLNKAEQGKKIIQQMTQIEYGELKIGVTYAMRQPLLHAVKMFHQRYPNIHLHLKFATTNELLHELKTMQIDLAVSFLDQHYKDDELTIQPLLKSPLVFVQSKSKPFIQKKQILIKDLQHIPLALPEKGFSTRQHLDKLFQEKDISPSIQLEINDISALFQLIESGQWATVTSSVTINPNLDLEIIPIKSIDHMREASLLTISGQTPNPTVRALIELIQQEIPQK